MEFATPRIDLELRPVTERHDGQQLGEEDETAKQTQADEALPLRGFHAPATKVHVVRYRQIIYGLRNLTLSGDLQLKNNDLVSLPETFHNIAGDIGQIELDPHLLEESSCRRHQGSLK